MLTPLPPSLPPSLPGKMDMELHSNYDPKNTKGKEGGGGGGREGGCTYQMAPRARVRREGGRGKVIS